jgi:hypothetical protein
MQTNGAIWLRDGNVTIEVLSSGKYLWIYWAHKTAMVRFSWMIKDEDLVGLVNGLARYPAEGGREAFAVVRMDGVDVYGPVDTIQDFMDEILAMTPLPVAV